MIYLNSMKSRCFMLVACVILVLGVTSCNSDDFDSITPDEQKELSNAELIEQALSRMPKTRGNAPFPVSMIVTQRTVTIDFSASEDMVIWWDDEGTTTIKGKTFANQTYTFSKDKSQYIIFLQGSNEALNNLDVYNNGLTYLEVTNNTNLMSLLCLSNRLTELDLTGCTNLRTIWAGYNNLSSIDVSHLSQLESLLVDANQLTNIDVSKNQNLQVLHVGKNQITDLDLTKNTNLWDIRLSDLSIKTINNSNISDRSFAAFPKLQQLDVSYTPFTSLDLSNNPLVEGLQISGTAITQLDISNLQMVYLYATNSNLTNLTYTSNNLLYTVELSVKGTPFEALSSNLVNLITRALPDRNAPNKNGHIQQGHLYTSSDITLWMPLVTAKNWVVNQ